LNFTKIVQLTNIRKYWLAILFFCFQLNICIFSTYAEASGGYDNGTAIKKGKIGIDLTWNLFNIFPNGQSYAVLSYGITDKFNIHGYYSMPSKRADNYYIGIFYQFYNNNNLDLATAIGIRNYNPKAEQHIFAPQLLYTLHLKDDYHIGGSIVQLIDINRNNKFIGRAFDIAIIKRLFNNHDSNSRLNSIDFCIGAFRPALWNPNSLRFHPTYSLDFKINI